MKQKKAKALTLLELFVSLTLLALIGSIIAIKGESLVQYYTLNHQKGILEEEVQFARHISAIYRCDMEVFLTNTKQGLQVQIKSDEPIPFIQKRKPQKLKNLRLKDGLQEEIVFFQGEAERSKDLVLISKGQVINLKVIR